MKPHTQEENPVFAKSLVNPYVEIFITNLISGLVRIFAKLHQNHASSKLEQDRFTCQKTFVRVDHFLQRSVLWRVF